MLKKILLAGLCAVSLALPAVAQYLPGFSGYYQNRAPSYLLSSPSDLLFSNLAPGTPVGRIFDVNGITSAFNQLTVTVSITNTPYTLFSSTFQADPYGGFGIRVDASRAPRNSLLTVTAQARDHHGNLGPLRVTQVVRR